MVTATPPDATSSLQTFIRTLVYALALYGGADLVGMALADDIEAKAYMPLIGHGQGIQQDGLEERVRSLETLLEGVDRSGGDLYFSGMNVYVVSGEGNTDAPPNGKGNLIIGYNEPRGGRDLEGNPHDRREGSHNLVLGTHVNYTGIAGVVTGYQNEIGGEYAVVLGGSANRADQSFSAILGGSQNTALSELSTAVGGSENQPGGLFSTISGGRQNRTLGEWSSIGGGQGNLTGSDAASATIAGGRDNEAGAESSAIGGGVGVEIGVDERSGSWAAGNLRWP